MFLRWETRRRTGAGVYRDPADAFTLIARLTETRRVDGRPRHRTVAYLGSIWGPHLRTCWARDAFRQRITDKLTASVSDAEECNRLVAGVARHVPEPTEQERAAEDAARLTARARSAGALLEMAVICSRSDDPRRRTKALEYKAAYEAECAALEAIGVVPTFRGEGVGVVGTTTDGAAA